MGVESRPTEKQKDDAALWLAKRAGGSMSRTEARAFDEWLNRDAGNRLAFDEMRVLWAQLEAPAEVTASHYPLRGAFQRFFWSVRTWAAAPAALAMVLLSIWVVNPEMLTDWGADIASGHKSVTEVNLPDGSSAWIGADTALALHFSETERRVDILHGEAFFDVRHGGSPAFVVEAEGGRVRVVGTRFNVNTLGDTMHVVVQKGRVEVTGKKDSEPRILMPGDLVSVREGHAGPVKAANIDDELAWMSGRLVVRDRPVREVAGILSRQEPGWIVVGDRLGAETVSGTFPLDDIDAALNTIAAATGGEIIHATPWVTVVY